MFNQILIKIRGPARNSFIICSEVLLTHLFFPGCVRLVGDLAHLERSPSHPPHVPLKYKNSFGHKGGRRERLGAVKHVRIHRISAWCSVDGSRGLKTSTLIHQNKGKIQKRSFSHLL